MRWPQNHKLPTRRRTVYYRAGTIYPFLCFKSNILRKFIDFALLSPHCKRNNICVYVWEVFVVNADSCFEFHLFSQREKTIIKATSDSDLLERITYELNWHPWIFLNFSPIIFLSYVHIRYSCVDVEWNGWEKVQIIFIMNGFEQ